MRASAPQRPPRAHPCKRQRRHTRLPGQQRRPGSRGLEPTIDDDAAADPGPASPQPAPVTVEEHRRLSVEKCDHLDGHIPAWAKKLRLLPEAATTEGANPPAASPELLPVRRKVALLEAADPEWVLEASRLRTEAVPSWRRWWLRQGQDRAIRLLWQLGPVACLTPEARLTEAHDVLQAAGARIGLPENEVVTYVPSQAPLR